MAALRQADGDERPVGPRKASFGGRLFESIKHG
jgi:hypothetical protein